MNQTEQVLLQAIQKSLWNTDVLFPKDTDWNAVLQEAEDQAVLGIVIDVAPADFQEKWKGRAGSGMAHFVRILHYQEQLYKLLKENGIPMVILKGTAAAIYYSNPLQRAMGDIDFLIPPEYFNPTKELLRQNEYTVEDDHPLYSRHIRVQKDGISFEQHRFFSSEGVEIEDYILDGLQKVENQYIYGIEFPMLPKLANGMVLLGHLAHHLSAGLGLRQVIDWMMYVERELSDSFWADTFGAAAKNASLDTLAVVVTKLCQEYLGLSKEIRWCEGADPDLCSELMDSLLSSGNFNRKRGSGFAIETVRTNISRKGLFRNLQSAGEYNWKAYHKHRWLKPFAWLYQIGRYSVKGFQAKRGGQLREDLARGKQRSQLLEKLRIRKGN